VKWVELGVLVSFECSWRFLVSLTRRVVRSFYLNKCKFSGISELKYICY